MRKLLLISVLVLGAAAVFAQDAPAPKYEIYGSTNFDFQQSGTEAKAVPAIVDGFTFSKLRFGFKAQLDDGLKSTLEIDPRNGEFRHAYIDWAPAEGLTVTAGKTYILFEQIVAIYGGSRMLLLGAKYSVPGLGWVGLQAANKSDISFISGNYMIFPPTVAGANQTQTLKFVQDPYLYLFPAIAFKPDLGDIKLEVGAESQMIPQQMGNPDHATGLSLDGYVTASAYGLTLTAEFAWFNINDSTSANQRYQFYTQLTYNAGMVAPTVYLVADAKKDFSNNPDTALGVELPVQVAKNFKITPLFSYAIANYNAFEGNNAIVDHLYDKNDWTFGIRFDYAFSAKF